MWERYINDAKSLLTRTLEDIQEELKHESCEWLDEDKMAKNLELIESAISNLDCVSFY